MPQLRPFRALRYDLLAVPDLSAVLCPPYDVIDAAQRAELAALDQRNAVNVELPVAGAGAASPYAAAEATFNSWIADGTLRRDEVPLLYIYDQEYEGPDGQPAAARGIFGQLRLEAYGPHGGVLAHEHTMTAPREDRFRLLSAVRANLSPVLLLYDDQSGGERAADLLSTLTGAAPVREAVGPGGLRNRLWLADPATDAAARELLNVAGANPLTIADGHHRYETALRYRDQPGAPAGADHVLALLYEANSGGLALLPWHRLLSGVDGAGLLAAAADWFAVQAVRDAADLVGALTAAGESTAGVVGLWTRAGGALLHVDRTRVAGLLGDGGSETLRWLDVSVVSGTLSRMIGTPLSELVAEGRLTYLADAGAAVTQVEAGQADVAVLLRPTPIASVLAVAAAGEHMPAKSTFFHPKAATGLVFNPLDSEPEAHVG